MDGDGASIHLDEAFADHEAHSNALVIHLGRALELAKEFEQLGDVFVLDALPGVNDVYLQHLRIFVIGNDESNETSVGKLEGVLDQVDQDLLQSHLITA